ncbi:MAG TPA: ORF6N domain-containing protein [Verrucomicrobiaceae bacterium]
MSKQAPYAMSAGPAIPIVTLRGERVILDADLAKLYDVETRTLNQAVKRNKGRFPDDFCFQITKDELENLKSQFVISSLQGAIQSRIASGVGRYGGRRALPLAFTEHGALQAANILRSPEAAKMGIFIIRAFVKMREALAANASILKCLAEIDCTLLLHDHTLRDVYQKLLPLLAPPPDKPRKPIGFHPDPG